MKKSSYSLVDVSHVVQHGMLTYKGLPAPTIDDHLSRTASRKHYANGTEFQIGKIAMVANTGTYVDAPFHRYAEGNDISQLPLSSLANLDGIVFQAASQNRAISRDLFKNAELRGKAVLIHTGWDKHWGTEQYFAEHPYLTKDTAEYLKDTKVALVGIDSLNIDDTSDGQRPVHSILLRADIPIIEHLCNLTELPKKGFKFYAVPVKVKGFGTFPVRAFGVIQPSKGANKSAI